MWTYFALYVQYITTCIQFLAISSLFLDADNAGNADGTI